jgi:glycosyltransferase involved in cell wall biosynthesis
VKVLVVPRDRNPYQMRLYGEMERLGARVAYAGELTGSHSLNVLLLPFQLIARRWAGWRVLHIHWVWWFSLLPVNSATRALAQGWFAINLLLCRVLGIEIVWTAHNVLPHERVFHNDLVARRWLVRLSDVVIAHDAATVAELQRMGASAREVRVIPHGPFEPSLPSEALRVPGSGSGPHTLLLFGQISPYKGAEDLLQAVLALDPEVQLRVIVAGQCRDRALSTRLRHLADQAGDRVELNLGYLSDEELAAALSAADGVALPYRTSTTSGAVELALGAGRPVILPELPSFEALAGEAVFGFDGTIDGLRGALTSFAQADPQRLAAAGRAAAALAQRHSWSAIAADTYAAMDRAPGGRSGLSRLRGSLRNTTSPT